MYYFKQTEQNIQKYEISFDIEKLNKLKREIIEKYSRIEHNEYENDYSPRLKKNSKCEYTNYNSTYTGKHQEYFEESRPIYLFSYDAIIYPPLVVAINELIEGDSKAIEPIFEFENDNKDEMIMALNSKIEKLSIEIDKIPNTSFTKKRKKLNELEKLIKQLKECKKKDPITPYYKKVQNLIKVDLVDTLSITEIDRINDFFSTSNKDEKTIDIKKLNLSKQ